MMPSLATVHQDEAALIDALRRRDGAAFMRLVTEYGPRMRAVIRRYLRDESDADDALQDAFISVARAIGRFNHESSLSTWLHTVAVRSALMKLRSRKRLSEETSIETLLPQFNAIGHRVATPASALPVPEQLESKQTQEIVRDQIEKLPEPYRVVLMARDIEQLSTEEASEALGLSEPALKTRLHRARAALKTLLEPYLRSRAI